MKPLKRIFLVLGALSIFSLIQFDAMAANDCTKNVKPGEYCKQRGTTPECPEGCFCLGNTKTHIYGVDVDSICRHKVVGQETDPEKLQALRKMHYAGIYVCGIDYTSISSQGNVNGFANTNITYNTSNGGGIHMKPDSAKGSDEENDCKASFCANRPEDGKYCLNKQSAKCPAGCYCTKEGQYKTNQRNIGVSESVVVTACKNHPTDVDSVTGFDIKEYLEARGVFYCPEGTTSKSGAKSCSEAERVSGTGKPCNSSDKLAAAGYFCKAGLTYKCPKGCYCEGGKNTNTGWAIDSVFCGNKNNATKLSNINTPNNTGIHLCPEGYDDGEKGATSITDCKNSSGDSFTMVNYKKPRRPGTSTGSDTGDDDNTSYVCNPGYYLPDGRTSEDDCTKCEKGYKCPGNDEREMCTGRTYTYSEGQSSCATCAVGREVVVENGLNVGCKPKTVADTPTDPAGQQQSHDDRGLCQVGEVYCASGQYLPSTGLTCGACPAGYVCRGGCITPNSSDNGAIPASEACSGNNQVANSTRTGCRDCEDYQKPNNAHTDCIARCQTAGEYWNGSTCAACPKGHYCSDGDKHQCSGNTYTNLTGQSSCTPCPDDQTANDDHTGCDSSGSAAICVAGTYMPTGGTSPSDCESCEDTGYFCRGGDKIKECPLEGETTNNGKSCKVVLGKEDLEEGTLGDCWKITNQSEYRECIYGFDLEDYR